VARPDRLHGERAAAGRVRRLVPAPVGAAGRQPLRFPRQPAPGGRPALERRMPRYRRL